MTGLEAVTIWLARLLVKATTERERADNPRRWDAEKANVRHALREALADPSELLDLDRLRGIAEQAAKVLGDADGGVTTLRRMARENEEHRKASTRRRKAARKKASHRTWRNGGTRKKAGSGKKGSRRKSVRRRKA